jgi:type II secretory pathway component PulC
VKKEQIQIAVICIGLLMLAFFALSNFKKAAKRPAPPPPAAAPATEAVMGAPVDGRSRDSISALQAKRWESGWGRDPFWVLSDSTGTLSELELKGISFSGSKKGFAFINDQIVSIGDMIGGYEISRIEKDRVMLTRGTQTFFLTFSEKK